MELRTEAADGQTAIPGTTEGPQLDRAFVDHMLLLIKDGDGRLDEERERAFLSVLQRLNGGFRQRVDDYLYGVHAGHSASPRRRVRHQETQL